MEKAGILGEGNAWSAGSHAHATVLTANASASASISTTNGPNAVHPPDPSVHRQYLQGAGLGSRLAVGAKMDATLSPSEPDAPRANRGGGRQIPGPKESRYHVHMHRAVFVQMPTASRPQRVSGQATSRLPLRVGMLRREIPRFLFPRL